LVEIFVQNSVFFSWAAVQNVNPKLEQIIVEKQFFREVKWSRYENQSMNVFPVAARFYYLRFVSSVESTTGSSLHDEQAFSKSPDDRLWGKNNTQVHLKCDVFAWMAAEFKIEGCAHHYVQKE